ncbi:MAG: SIS domain-containing protein [Phycisphaeraceae bacterium]|nr:SIS domain-containing protein [Phycisphaeraceae bacterium]
MPQHPSHPSIPLALAVAAAALESFRRDEASLAAVDAAASTLVATLRAGGKVLICGNGGSLCDAAHFAEELTGRFRADRAPLAAIACTEPGHITCTANDYGFEHVFSRWVRGLGRPGDTLILLSTSGNSPNMLRAHEAASELGIATISLLGRRGGEMAGRCTHEIIVPGATSDRIQELHMLILHAWVEAIEAAL